MTQQHIGAELYRRAAEDQTEAAREYLGSAEISKETADIWREIERLYLHIEQQIRESYKF